MIEIPKYRGLSFLVYQLTALIDSGDHDGIDVAEALQRIREGDLFSWLRSLAPDRVDLSLYGSQGPYVNVASEWIEGLQALADSYGDQTGRKWGVENRGLCLLLAWTFELFRVEVDRFTEKHAPPAEATPSLDDPMH